MLGDRNQAGEADAPERVRLTEWHDRRRDRTIPVLIRTPAAFGSVPLVLLSHGLGGSRHGLAYLGRALAAAGYAAVHLQHPGSDAGIWRGQSDPRAGMAAAALDPAAALARLQDVAFALDHVLDGREDGLEVDRSRLAIAGHSYGAWTASHMIGQRLPVPVPLRLPEPRLRAAVLLSPLPPIGVGPDTAYRDIRVPTLHVTGTRDHGFGVADWRTRTLGFRQVRAPAVLVTLEGASHAAFAGEEELGGYWNEPAYHSRTAGATLAFLDTVLRDSAGAASALLEGSGLRPGDTTEARNWRR